MKYPDKSVRTADQAEQPRGSNDAHATVGKRSLTEHKAEGEWRWRDSPPSDHVIQHDAAAAHDTSAHDKGGYDMHVIAEEAKRFSAEDKTPATVEPSTHGVPAHEHAATAAEKTADVAAGPGPNPQVGPGPNPQVGTDGQPKAAADPFVLPLGSTWYLYTTGLGISKSIDQGKTWAYVGQLFTPPSDIKNAWAPEVHVINGQFVAYAALGKAGQPLQVYVATSSKPDSDFVLHKKPIVRSTNHALKDPDPGAPVSMIDPTSYNDGHQNWLIWKEDWKVGVARRRIVMAKCNEAGTQLIGKPHILLVAGVGLGAAAREQRADRSTPNYSIEAPTLVFHGGKYWLFYSGAGFEKHGGYFIGVAWSKEITGPYQREPRPLITGNAGALSPGHQSVIQVTINGKTEWLIYYHAWSGNPADDGKSRYLMSDPLHWGEHGPYVKGGHPSGSAGPGEVAPPATAPAPAAPAVATAG